MRKLFYVKHLEQFLACSKCYVRLCHYCYCVEVIIIDNGCAANALCVPIKMNEIRYKEPGTSGFRQVDVSLPQAPVHLVLCEA